MLAALAYADVFRWPSTAAEIHGTLAIDASVDDVLAAVESAEVRDRIASRGCPHAMRGDADQFAQRRWREEISNDLWRRARVLGKVVAGLPFVKFVGISGSLALDDADADAHIDLFVVFADGRVWTSTALIVGVVRAARRAQGRVSLCPNYIVAESRLGHTERSAFAAHEFAELARVSGAESFADVLAVESWVRNVLTVLPGAHDASGPEPRITPSSEPALAGRAFDRLEHREMDRKGRRLGRSGRPSELRFDASVCKGQLDAHTARLVEAYDKRLSCLGIAG
jgi:hypothetical protein